MLLLESSIATQTACSKTVRLHFADYVIEARLHDSECILFCFVANFQKSNLPLIVREHDLSLKRLKKIQIR